MLLEWKQRMQRKSRTKREGRGRCSSGICSFGVKAVEDQGPGGGVPHLSFSRLVVTVQKEQAEREHTQVDAQVLERHRQGHGARSVHRRCDLSYPPPAHSQLPVNGYGIPSARLFRGSCEWAPSRYVCRLTCACHADAYTHEAHQADNGEVGAEAARCDHTAEQEHARSAKGCLCLTPHLGEFAAQAPRRRFNHASSVTHPESWRHAVHPAPVLWFLFSSHYEAPRPAHHYSAGQRDGQRAMGAGRT
jgi:hypothetical protein